MSEPHTAVEAPIFPIKRTDDPDYFPETRTDLDDINARDVAEARTDEEKKQAIRRSVLPELHLRPRSKEEDAYFAKVMASDYVAPDIEGHEEAQAVAHIQGAGLTVGKIRKEHHASVKKGTIIAGDPGKDTKVLAGSPVDIVVSDGPEDAPSDAPDPVYPPGHPQYVAAKPIYEGVPPQPVGKFAQRSPLTPGYTPTQPSTETVYYADGSSATGPGPLPRVSPQGSPAITGPIAPSGPKPE